MPLLDRVNFCPVQDGASGLDHAVAVCLADKLHRLPLPKLVKLNVDAGNGPGAIAEDADGRNRGSLLKLLVKFTRYLQEGTFFWRQPALILIQINDLAILIKDAGL